MHLLQPHLPSNHLCILLRHHHSHSPHYLLRRWHLHLHLHQRHRARHLLFSQDYLCIRRCLQRGLQAALRQVQYLPYPRTHLHYLRRHNIHLSPRHRRRDRHCHRPRQRPYHHLLMQYALTTATAPMVQRTVRICSVAWKAMAHATTAGLDHSQVYAHLATTALTVGDEACLLRPHSHLRARRRHLHHHHPSRHLLHLRLLHHLVLRHHVQGCLRRCHLHHRCPCLRLCMFAQYRSCIYLRVNR
mmetsp:Transcript_415/g.1048  ORF Transcript_415/g.1048 Transcript_415/m.1048 type:complete len:244 (+) Transcript_415:362-1093(+)